MANNEDIKTQYIKMVEDFKKNCTALLDSIPKQAMDEFEKATNTNFDAMAQAYVKGCKDLKDQALKGNQAMIEKFQSNYKAAQQSLDDTFNQMKNTDMTQFQSNVSKFTEAFDSTLSKVPILKMAINLGSDATAQYLNQKKKETIDMTQLKLTEATKALKESAEDTVKKLTLKMDDLTPKLVKK